MKRSSKSFEDFTVGEEETISINISTKLVDDYVSLTGDDNPLHVSDEFSKQTEFGRKVVHGMLGVNFLSTLIGTKLPGPGALWLSQEINFISPVFIDDILIVSSKVEKKNVRNETLSLSVKCEKSDGVPVFDGNAEVKILETKSVPRETRTVSKKGLILVIGGSGAIGSQIVEDLIENGWPVMATYRNYNERICTLEQISKDNGARLELVKFDIEFDSTSTLLDIAFSSRFPVYGLVYTLAPPISPQEISSISIEILMRHVQFGLIKPQELFGAFASKLGSLGGSVVSLTSEVAGSSMVKNWGAYTLGKSNLATLTNQFALEFAQRNVRFNSVAPSLLDTDYVTQISQKEKLMLANKLPLRRLCSTRDVSNAVKFLMSEEASFITGHVLELNGGNTLL